MPRNPKIEKETDYVVAKVYQNSLARVLEKHPDGVNDEFARKCLQLTKQELDILHASAIEKLKKIVK